jgi:quinol monooxygenase YgiN
MYARVTTFKVDPARLGEVLAKIKEMGPAAEALPGVIDVYAAWRGDGQGCITAIYKSKADADAAAPKIQALWASLSGLISGAPSTEAYDSVEQIAG